MIFSRLLGDESALKSLAALLAPLKDTGSALSSGGGGANTCSV